MLSRFYTWSDSKRRLLATATTVLFLMLAVGIAVLLPVTHERDGFSELGTATATGSTARIKTVSPDDPRSFVGVDYMYDFSPATMLAALSKNIGMHLGGTSRAHNRRIVESVRRLHEALGVPFNRDRDGRPLPEHLHYSVGQSLDEDLAINPWHFRLFGVCCILLMLWYRLYRPYTSGVAVCLIISFVIFSIWFSWTPFSTRRHLPLFVAGCAVIAVVLDRCDRWDAVLSIAGLALALLSIPWLTSNTMRPLLGPHSIFKVPRASLYFVKYPQLVLPANVLAELITRSKANSVGIYASPQATEYPFLVSIQQAAPHVRIRHIAVDNGTQAYDRRDAGLPDLILALPYEELEFLVQGTNRYKRIWRYPELSLYASDEFLARYANDQALTVSNAYAALSQTVETLVNTYDAQLLQNGRFLDGLTGWQPWGNMTAFSNGVRVVGNRYLRIENPSRTLVGVAQYVPVTSGQVYRLSGRARSTGRTTSEVIFGGRIALHVPGQKEIEVVWPTEYIYWSDRSTVFTNMVDGLGRVFVHMGYGNVASTGEFTNIRLETVD